MAGSQVAGMLGKLLDSEGFPFLRRRTNFNDPLWLERKYRWLGHSNRSQVRNRPSHRGRVSANDKRRLSSNKSAGVLLNDSCLHPGCEKIDHQPPAAGTGNRSEQQSHIAHDSV
jgi:hypothetical protein